MNITYRSAGKWIEAYVGAVLFGSYRLSRTKNQYYVRLYKPWLVTHTATDVISARHQIDEHVKAFEDRALQAGFTPPAVTDTHLAEWIATDTGGVQYHIRAPDHATARDIAISQFLFGSQAHLRSVKQALPMS